MSIIFYFLAATFFTIFIFGATWAALDFVFRLCTDRFKLSFWPSLGITMLFAAVLVAAINFAFTAVPLPHDNASDTSVCDASNNDTASTSSSN